MARSVFSGSFVLVRACLDALYFAVLPIRAVAMVRTLFLILINCVEVAQSGSFQNLSVTTRNRQDNPQLNTIHP